MTLIKFYVTHIACGKIIKVESDCNYLEKDILLALKNHSCCDSL